MAEADEIGIFNSRDVYSEALNKIETH